MKFLSIPVVVVLLSACGGDSDDGSNMLPDENAENVIAVSDTVDIPETITLDICLGSAGSPPDIYITGSRNAIAVPAGCTIRDLRVSGNFNNITVDSDVTITAISFTGEATSNIIHVPDGFATSVINNVNASNCVLLPGTGGCL